MDFELRNIRSDDPHSWARGEAFLLENPNEAVRNRPPGEYDRARKRGQGFILTEGPDIRGLSLVYDYDTSPSGRVYIEIGTMRITANRLGLQIFFAKFHLFQIHLEEYGAKQPIFAVVSPGSASEHNLEDGVGMQAWDPPEALQVIRQTRSLPFAADKRVLAADHGCIGEAFRDLSKWHLGGRLFRTPKGDRRIKVCMEWFSPELLRCFP